MSASIHALSTSPVLVLLAKATLLLAAVWLLHLILRPANPRWRVWLWRTAIVGLTILPVMERVVPRWRIDVPTQQRVIASESQLDPTPTTSPADIPGTSPHLPHHPTVDDVAGSAADFQNSPVARTVAESREVGAVAGIAWGTVACLVWLSIAGLLLLRLFRNALRIRRMVWYAEPAERVVVEIAQVAMAATGLRSIPDVRVSSSIDIPFATGLLRPVVIVPTDIVQQADAVELQLILTHEFGHLAGRDIPWTTFAWIVRAIMWFHPLVWRMPSAHQVACETVCDAIATRSDASLEAYRRMLARLALLIHCRQAIDCGVAMSATADITRRLRRLARHVPSERLSLRRRLQASCLGFVGLLATAAATVVPLARATETPAVATSSSEGASQALPQDKPTQSAESVAQADDARWKIRLRAIDADTDKPIANPRFEVQLGKEVTWHDGHEDGEFLASIPSRIPRYCYLKVRADGYTPMRGFWGNRSNDTRDELPEQLTFRMTRGITVGGMVVNEERKPVQGATVLFSAGTRRPEKRIEQSFWQEKYITDAEGRWQCTIAPREMASGSININHPDYALVTSNWSVDRAIDKLKARQYTWMLKKGFVIQGVVTDQDGAPVANAHLATGTLNSYSHDGPFAVTDVDGRYKFHRIGSATLDTRRTPLQMSVTILGNGLAPQMAVVPGTGERQLGASTWEERTLNFQLDKGKPLSIRVTDGDGKPVEKVWIFPSEWRDGTNGLTVLREHGIPQYSDKDGVWRWETAPTDEQIGYDILGRGFMGIRDKKLVAGQDYEIKLTRPQVLIGRVIDADTKMPIDEFVIQKGFEGMSRREYPDGVLWTSNSQGRNGRYRRVVSLPRDSYRWRFVAEGYEPFDSDSIPVTEGEVTIDVALKKKNSEVPSKDPTP